MLAGLLGLGAFLAPRPGAAAPVCAEAWGRPEVYAADQDYAALRAAFPRTGCRKRWTALIWLAGDSEDLVAPMRANLAALAAGGGSTADLDVVVLHDDFGPGGLKRLHIFGGATAEVGGFADESAPPEDLLRRFLTWGVAEYPADHYLVVLAGHGLGWRPILPEVPPDARQFDLQSRWGGFGFDATDGTVLDLPTLRRTLEGVVDGPLQGRPFDVVLSDACLMQSMEVATELADVARYLGGSEQVQPYAGLPYGPLLKRMRRPPTDPVDGCTEGDSPCRLAHQAAALQQQALDRDPTAEGPTRDQYTYAVVDTAELRLRLVPALATLADRVAEQIERAPEASIDFGVVLSESPGFLGGTRDLGVVLERIQQINPPGRGGPSGAVLTAARDAALALDTTVVDHAFGRAYRSEPRYLGMRGLAIWLPINEADRDRRLEFFLQSRLHRTLGRAPGQAQQRWARMLALTFAPPLPGNQCPVPE